MASSETKQIGACIFLGFSGSFNYNTAVISLLCHEILKGQDTNLPSPLLLHRLDETITIKERLLIISILTACNFYVGRSLVSISGKEYTIDLATLILSLNWVL